MKLCVEASISECCLRLVQGLGFGVWGLEFRVFSVERCMKAVVSRGRNDWQEVFDENALQLGRGASLLP